ncbi:uncharacterized protein LOC143291599 [Babylonia areolata]|uniref:uncharacterized protein LOC143291599 n=1 Tax=Babylonia areolata TaxID=304850 RepID=UPI003FD537A7
MALSPSSGFPRPEVEQCVLTDDPNASFNDHLLRFPHTFQMQVAWNPNQVKSLTSGLESALEVGYKTSLETARARNLLAFALYTLGRPDDALKELDRVLSMEDQTNNLVTLANKAVILWRECELSRAQDQLEHLNGIQGGADFQYLVVKAKAELAFSYTRLGPKFSPSAVKLFQEVIPNAQEPEIWLWNFGLALTKRRALSADHETLLSTPTDRIEAESRDILGLFLRVANNCSCPNLKAKTYAEIATLLSLFSGKSIGTSLCDMVGMRPRRVCYQALEYDRNDRSVLSKCGIVLKVCGDYHNARHFLEESLRLRPSSKGHHHLGDTYKILAMQLSDMPSVPEGQLHEQVSAECLPYKGIKPAQGQVTDAPTFSSNTTVTTLSQADRYMDGALHQFEKAIQISEGLNNSALFDLSLLQRRRGHGKEAMKTIKEILKRPFNMSPYMEIRAYDDMGQILGELAHHETDYTKKEHLRKDSRLMLLQAAKRASKIFAHLPGISEDLNKMFSSFSILLTDVDSSEEKTSKKLEKKIPLLMLCKEHKLSLDMLRELAKLEPEREGSTEHQKLCIECCVELEDYEEAFTFIEKRKCIPQREILQICTNAARVALLRGSAPGIATEYFKFAFDEYKTKNWSDTSSSELDESDSESKTRQGTLDVVLVHDDASAAAKALKLHKALKGICGLNVADVDKDPPANKPDLQGAVRIIRNSIVAVVMPGQNPSKKMRLLIEHAAKRPTTVTVTENGDHIPAVLKELRSLTCSTSLLQNLESASEGERTPPVVDAVCKVFSFLVGIEKSPM